MLIGLISYGQSGYVESILEEGVTLHDQGKYKEAIEKYKEALELDSNSVTAIYEMAYSYLMLKNNSETERLCKEAIANFPESEVLMDVYTSYANSLDMRGEAEEALKIYDEGIAKFPDYNMLHFNRAITLYGLEDFYGALNGFKKSARLNPAHASSFYYLGIVEDKMGNRISMILSLSYFLILEPKGARAKLILPYLTDKVNNMYAYRKSGGTISTVSTAGARMDTTASEFKEVESALAMLAVLMSIPGMEEKYKSEQEEFKVNIETIFQLLKANKEVKTGFYWEFLVPFFVDLEELGFVETFVYDINSFESDSKRVAKWVKRHRKKLDVYIAWVNKYEFKK